MLNIASCLKMPNQRHHGSRNQVQIQTAFMSGELDVHLGTGGLRNVQTQYGLSLKAINIRDMRAVGAEKSGSVRERLLAGRRIAVGVAALALALCVSGFWLLTDAPPAQSIVTGATPGAVAENSSCVDQCQTSHDRCRISTKGSSACDDDRQRCLQQCLIRKRK